MRPERARARVLLVVLLYLAAVDAVAFAARGRMASPLPLPWSAEADRRMPPLARFDAGWYLSVAEHGYPADLARGETNAVFLPLFPFAMRVVSAAARVPLLWAGLLAAHACAIGAALLLSRYAALFWPGSDPGAVVARFLLYPFSFFLAAPYSESLFLLLAIATFLLLRTGRPAAAVACGVLAGLTRVTALALVPALLLARVPRRRALAAALGPLAGFALFYVPLALRYRDPLFYVHVERAGWSRDPSASGIAAAFSALARLERGLTLQLVVLVLVGAAAAWLARRDRSEAAYAGSGLALMLVSGSLVSNGRYALSLFPTFRPLAALRVPRALAVAAGIGAAAFQAYLVARFANNLWVS